MLLTLTYLLGVKVRSEGQSVKKNQCFSCTVSKKIRLLSTMSVLVKCDWIIQVVFKNLRVTSLTFCSIFSYKYMTTTKYSPPRIVQDIIWMIILGNLNDFHMCFYLLGLFFNIFSSCFINFGGVYIFSWSCLCRILTSVSSALTITVNAGI